MTWDVFVSHSSDDKPTIRPIVEAMRQRGLRVWFDEDSIGWGQSIWRAIDEGIAHSRVMLVCLSSAYLKSEWTQSEIAATQYRDPGNRDRSILPLMLEPCDIPTLLRPIKYLDWSQSRLSMTPKMIADAIVDLISAWHGSEEAASGVADDGRPRSTHERGGEEIPAGTFHDGDEIPEAPPGTFHGGDDERVPAVTNDGCRGLAPPHSEGMRSVLLVTALGVETEALRRLLAFSEAQRTSGPPRGFDTYMFPSGRRLTVANTGGTGRLSAALYIQRLCAEAEFDVVVLVGICAGIGKDVRIGDVVVSDQIVDYEPAKVTDAGTQRRFSVFRSSFGLGQAMTSFDGGSWRWLLDGRLPEGRTPVRHVGTVLSGDKVIASSRMKSMFLKQWPQALALEMEAAGLAAALSAMGAKAPDFVVVKAVCDLADSSKSDAFQQVAAMAAAAFALEFFMTLFG
jgi:nucleoside phosphorylase